MKKINPKYFVSPKTYQTKKEQIFLIEDRLYLKDFNIVGADIMELAPDIDTTKTSTATCCKLIREVLMLL